MRCAISHVTSALRRIDFNANAGSVDQEATQALDIFRHTVAEELAPVETLLGDLAYLHKLAAVADRHALYAPKYLLYETPRCRLTVSEPIDKIIAESTKRPELIYALSSRDFERLLGRIFEGFGYEVEVTAQTRDGNADLLCVSRMGPVSFKLAVEAKRYAPNRPVGVRLIRQFWGANQKIMADKLMVVTTSRFTRDALEFAMEPGVARVMELRNQADVVQWADDVTRRGTLPTFSGPSS